MIILIVIIFVILKARNEDGIFWRYSNLDHPFSGCCTYLDKLHLCFCSMDALRADNCNATNRNAIHLGNICNIVFFYQWETQISSEHCKIYLRKQVIRQILLTFRYGFWYSLRVRSLLPYYQHYIVQITSNYIKLEKKTWDSWSLIN